MATKIQNCNPALARRILAQMQAEDAGKLRPIRQPEPAVQKPKPPQLLRQNTRGPNKLEAAFAAVLRAENPGVQIREQAVTLVLCNGVRFTLDMFAFVNGQMKAWETKGFMRDDAAVKLKFAAKEWPEIEFILVWRKAGVWHRQRILA
jgi:hypothetical protein